MLEGQKVIYQGKETHVEKVLKAGRVLIANPEWDWDEEGLCVDSGIEYLVPYWITVDANDLVEIDPDKAKEQRIIQENSHGFGVNVDDFIWMQNRKS